MMINWNCSSVRRAPYIRTDPTRKTLINKCLRLFYQYQQFALTDGCIPIMIHRAFTHILSRTPSIEIEREIIRLTPFVIQMGTAMDIIHISNYKRGKRIITVL